MSSFLLEEKLKLYLADPTFCEVLELVKLNSKGKIWLMGGFLYKNLASALYGGEIYNYDIDFLVEERNEKLEEVPSWRIEVNNYGVENYVRDTNRTSFTDIRKAIRVSGLKNPTVEEFIKETPLNIQSIVYSLDENVLSGEKGIEALEKKLVKVNNKDQAEFYAKRKGKNLEEIVKEKAKELNFNYELPKLILVSPFQTHFKKCHGANL